jgi:nucleoside-diphosphate-sugar epimerase
LTATVQDLIDSLEKITSAEVTKLIAYQPDAFLQSIVLTWPPYYETQRANQLGFVSDKSTEEIIRAFMQEEGIVYK